MVSHSKVFSAIKKYMFAVVSQLEVAMGHHPHLAHPHLRPCHHHSSLVLILRPSKGDSIIIIIINIIIIIIIIILHILTYALVIITAPLSLFFVLQKVIRSLSSPSSPTPLSSSQPLSLFFVLRKVIFKKWTWFSGIKEKQTNFHLMLKFLKASQIESETFLDPSIWHDH